MSSNNKFNRAYNYGENSFKPFFGELFNIDNISFVTQISSPKEKHKNMSDNKDFIKLINNKKELLGVVNLNYMFPVPKVLYSYIEPENIESFRKFNNEQDKYKYINLLKTELKIINNKSVDIKAKNLYDFVNKNKDSIITKRCFNFNYLLDFAKIYLSKLNNNIKMQNEINR